MDSFMAYANALASQMEDLLMDGKVSAFQATAEELARWIDETGAQPNWNKYRMAAREYFLFEEEITANMETGRTVWTGPELYDQDELPF